MDILKQNLFWIICGLVAAAGIALSAVGLKSMGEVRSRMGEARGLLRDLDAASRGETVNPAAIKAENRRVAAVKSHYREVVDWAYSLNRHAPLVPGVFPEPRGEKKQEFRNRYLEEIDRLLALLKAGEPPSQRDVAEMAETIKNERPRRSDLLRSKDRKPDQEVEEKTNRSGLLTDEQARNSPSARAALVRAHEIY